MACWKAYKAESCKKNEKVHFSLATLHLDFQARLLWPRLRWKLSLTGTFMLQEFLLKPCLTPDCIGQICRMEMFDATGLVKRKVR